MHDRLNEPRAGAVARHLQTIHGVGISNLPNGTDERRERIEARPRPPPLPLRSLAAPGDTATEPHMPFKFQERNPAFADREYNLKQFHECPASEVNFPRPTRWMIDDGAAPAKPDAAAGAPR